MNYSSYPPNYQQAAPQYQGFAQPSQPSQPNQFPPGSYPQQHLASAAAFPQQAPQLQNPQAAYAQSQAYPNYPAAQQQPQAVPQAQAQSLAQPLVQQQQPQHLQQVPPVPQVAPQQPSIEALPEVKAPPKISVACICQSNVNRSMEAHAMLRRHSELSIESFGVGSKIKIPGETAYSPNVYDFGATTYEFMVKDLRKKNEAKYTKNGMLRMLERDASVKVRPQRWQDQKTHFDLIITYEKRVFDIVVTDIESRANVDMRPCHVINIDTTDNHAEAAVGARLTDELVSRLLASPDWEETITKHLDDYESKYNKIVLHTVLFY